MHDDMSHSDPSVAAADRLYNYDVEPCRHSVSTLQELHKSRLCFTFGTTHHQHPPYTHQTCLSSLHHRSRRSPRVSLLIPIPCHIACTDIRIAGRTTASDPQAGADAPVPVVSEGEETKLDDSDASLEKDDLDVSKDNIIQEDSEVGMRDKQTGSMKEPSDDEGLEQE